MVVLVSGASVGYGRAIAKKFVQEGHKVITLARRVDKLQALQDECGAQNLSYVAQDICDIDSLKSTIVKLDNIDVLVNNAGLALGLSSAESCDIADWERMIEVNVLSLVRLTRLVLPQMVKQKRGHIVNISSIAASYPYPGSNVYGASKAFVKQFSLNLRADLYDKNIKVTNIEPGLSGGSEFSLVRFKGDKQKADKVYENIKPLLPEDIAEAVFWACSLPPHVNINRIELMPITQAPSALNVAKEK